MGVIRFLAQLQRRGPAAAVVLDETQVAAVGHGDAAVSPYTARLARKLTVSARTPGHPAIFAHMIGYFEPGHAALSGQPAAAQGKE